MRLIDADALLEEFPIPNDMTGPGSLWHITGIRAVIQCAPTVDESKPKYGTWKSSRFNGGPMYRCSVCGHFSEHKTPQCDKCKSVMRL